MFPQKNLARKGLSEKYTTTIMSILYELHVITNTKRKPQTAIPYQPKEREHSLDDEYINSLNSGRCGNNLTLYKYNFQTYYTEW